MGRAKQKMELIANEKIRNTTYRKRKLGAVKKAKELAILCDVGVVMIAYPPNSNEPEIWPENHDQVKNAINSYKRKKSESSIKTYELSDFFEDRKKKIEEELVKARKKNIAAKYPTWFDELDGLNEGQLRQFAIGLKNKENIVRDNLEAKKRNIFMQQVLTSFDPSTLPYAGGSYPHPDPHPHPSLYQVQAHPQPHPHPSLYQVQGVNPNHEVGWFHEPMYGAYPPQSEHGMVYDGTNPLAFEQPMTQYGPMTQFSVQPQANDGNFWDFSTDDVIQRLLATKNENLGVFGDRV